MGRRAALALVSLALASSASAAPGAAPQTLVLAGTVQSLAADGGRVAVLMRSVRPGCTTNPVAVWTPAVRSLVPLGSSGCLVATSTGSGVFGLALAGTRV